MATRNTTNTDANTSDDSPAQSDWGRTLESVPTLFGKLVYLAGLRDDSTGTYKHYGFTQRYTEAVTNTVIHESHERAFAQWLTLSIEEQRDEIAGYWAQEGSDPNLAVQNWLILEPFRRLPPASTQPAVRELYLSDIELVLKVIRAQIS